MNTEHKLISAPADGIPPVIDSQAGLEDAIDRLKNATGSLAIDTERAHGFRYYPKAYLIQLRRGNSGTILLDPLAFVPTGAQLADFSALSTAVSDAEWLLHAASQDLPCLSEVALIPKQLFDTELAARLLNMPKVNLAAVLETAFSLTLAKEHSAADWSRRPFPSEWLNYAALDVELLAELREWLCEELKTAGKWEWAQQEFAHIVTHATDPVPIRPERWRRTSGIHNVHSSRGLAAVRELWQVRDDIAEKLDLASGKVLKDQTIVEAAIRFDKAEASTASPNWNDVLRDTGGFRHKTAAKHRRDWLSALQRTAKLPSDQLPGRNNRLQQIPHPKNWEKYRPDAAARWFRVRPAVVERAEELMLPVENLIAPDALRKLIWDSSDQIDATMLAEKLTCEQARPWQIENLQETIIANW